MPEEYDNDLLREGILHFKSKEYDLARRYFERAMDAADDIQTRAEANFYMSQVVDDPGQKRQVLEQTLAIDMGHAEARRALAIMDGKLKPAAIVNPDAVPAPLPGTQEAQNLRFSCPRCGARMVYSPDGVSLICENCSHKQGLDSGSPGSDQDFFVAMANGKGFRKTISEKTFHCQGCGATFLLGSVDLSASCAYCGATHVLVMDDSRELVAPDAIVPMAFDQKQAAVLLERWFNEKHIVPQPVDQFPHGFYFPVWVFDLIGSLSWDGRVVRNKRELPVSGECPSQLNDICIPGSAKLGGLFLEILPGYDLPAAPAYDPRFLAGWTALVYDITMSEAALEARRITVERICNDIQLEQGHVIDLRYSTSSISITTYRLILLPVWLMDYSFEDRPYRLLINGQTGSVIGETPRRGLKDRLENLLSS
jgi:Zn finger protein HypA/HybF involved in hydrogenase expression